MSTKQPEALPLADEYARAHAIWAIEDLIGVRQTHIAAMLQKRHAARSAVEMELRRLHDLLGKANALCRIRAARIAELEARLEVDARHPYDGIACRDATIAELQAGYDAARLEIVSLHTQMDAVGAGGMESLRKREQSEPVAWVRKIVLEMRAMDDAQGDLLRRSERVRMKRPADESEYVALYAAQPSMECLHQISEPAVAQAPVASIYITNDGQREFDDWRAPLPVGRNELFAAPQPAAQALDAIRYQFLRDGEWRDTELEPFIRLQLNTMWDAKIDAAIAAQQGGANG